MHTIRKHLQPTGAAVLPGEHVHAWADWHLPVKKRGEHGPAALGLSMANLLRGAWRETPDPVPESLGPELPLAGEKLLDTGGGALGWWRLRGSALETAEGAERLHQAFRLHTLQAAQHARNLEHVLLHFNEVGLVPIVFKGWTMARLYAQPGLRPYGDIDLLVEERDEARARGLIARLSPELQGLVDLDMRVLRRFLPDRSFEELAGRASTLKLGAATFRVLSPEDHLRLVCLHQLDHGGWRPLWLCDVAALVESLPSGFSWELCLHGNQRLSDAVVALVRLAERLLGARLPPGTPEATVPRWFIDAVLRGWAGGYQAPPDSLFALNTMGVRRALKAVRARWPDPITATLHLRAPLNGVPRLPLQAAECVRRGALFVGRACRNVFLSSSSAASPGGQGVLS